MLKKPSRIKRMTTFLNKARVRFIGHVKKYLPKSRRRANAVLFIAAILLAAGLAAGAYYVVQSRQKAGNISAQPVSQPAGLVKGTPTYPILLPNNKNITVSDGWVRPGDKAVFVYTDKIGGVAISVSEQPLPDDFKTDTNQQMDTLAKAEKANQKITVGSTIVYIGSTSKGPQSVFLAKNNLLILIKSDDLITNNSWASYVNSLQ
jgi:hypothetical protein